MDILSIFILIGILVVVVLYDNKIFVIFELKEVVVYDYNVIMMYLKVKNSLD